MGVRRVAVTAGVALALAAPARAGAHDPFEITTDAHIDVYGLNLHTTLSLDSAARICLPSTPLAHRFAVAEFSQFRPQFERCGREFYALTAGGAPLSLRSLSLQLSLEDDLELRVVYDRPSKSPLSFDALGLKGLASGAGIVLTVTGQHSFLGQKLLTPADSRLDLSISPDAEAIGTPPLVGQALLVPPREHPALRALALGVLALLVVMGARMVRFSPGWRGKSQQIDDRERS